MGHRAVLIFSLCCEVVALAMFAHWLFLLGPSSRAVAIPFVLLLVGALGVLVGLALRHLSDRIDKMGAAEPKQDGPESPTGGPT